MRRLAWVLGVVAMVLVLGTTVVAVVVRHQPAASAADPSPAAPVYTAPVTTSPRPTPSAFASPFGAFDPEQVVYGETDDNAQFEVPMTDDWEIEDSGTILGYENDKSGKAYRAQVVAGPAVFKTGFCPDPEFDSANRAFVGFAPSAADVTPEDYNPRLAGAWVKLMALDADTGTSVHHSKVVTSSFTLTDGAVAVRSDAEVDSSGTSTCDPPSAHLTVISLDTGANVANVVLVRDADADGVLSPDLADQILATIQPESD